MTRVMACDPGEHRGYALTDPTDLRPRAFGKRFGRLLWCDRRLTPPPEGLAGTVRFVVEGQWLGKRINPRGLAKLSFRAGWLLRDMSADAEVLDVSVWKEVVFRGGGTMSKGVFLERLHDLVLPDEADLIPRKARGGVGTWRFDPDCLEAVGLSWAAGEVRGRTVNVANL